MEYRQRGGAGGGRFDEDRRECEPRYSRLFMLGAKNSTEDELKEVFSRFGSVEYVSIKKDHNTNAPKGFSYIKFRKTSDAAHALEEMNEKTIGTDPRPIKIVIATERSNDSKEEVRATRLFIKVPKTMTIPEIKEVFETFGPVEHVSLVRDKPTGNPRGLAFVNYHKFSCAAVAVESADESYQAKFAEPKGSGPPPGKSSNSGSMGTGDAYGSGGISGMVGMGGGYSDVTSPMAGGIYHPQQQLQPNNPMSCMINMMQGYQQAVSSSCRLKVLFNPAVSKDMFWALFNVVPGLVTCDLAELTTDGGIGLVVYSNPQSAAYAMERLNGFEYPTGSRLQIRIDESSNSYSGTTSMMPSNGMANGMGLSPPPPLSSSSSGGPMNSPMALTGVYRRQSAPANGQTVPSDVKTLIDTIQQATDALKHSGFGSVLGNGGSGGGVNDVDAQLVCSAILPPKQPILPTNTKTEERLFFVLREALDLPDPAIITDAFCRFGNLIEAQCIRNKKCGYARYGSKLSANQAIVTLNGEDLLGSRIKVEVADEDRRGKRPRTD